MHSDTEGHNIMMLMEPSVNDHEEMEGEGQVGIYYYFVNNFTIFNIIYNSF